MRAELVGYDCDVREPLGQGWVHAETHVPLDAESTERRLIWRPLGNRWQGNVIDLRAVMRWPSESAPTQLVSLEAQYSVRETPKAPTWLFMRMGEVAVQKIYYLPRGLRPERPSEQGHAASSELKGDLVAQQFLAGAPLEVMLLAADGRVLDQERLDFPAASEVLRAATAAANKAASRLKNPKVLCGEVHLEE